MHRRLRRRLNLCLGVMGTLGDLANAKDRLKMFATFEKRMLVEVLGVQVR